MFRQKECHRRTESPPAASEDKLVEMWLHGMAEHTQRSYQADLAQFRAFLGEVPLGDVMLQDVQAYSTHLEKRGTAKSTRARKLSTLRSLYAFGVIQDVFDKNPCLAVRMPKAKDGLAARILTVEQVRRMMAAAKARFPKLDLGKDEFSAAEVAETFGLRSGTVAGRIARRHGWKGTARMAEVPCRCDCPPGAGRRAARPRSNPPIYALRITRPQIQQLLSERGCTVPDLPKWRYTIPDVAEMAGVSNRSILAFCKRQGWQPHADYRHWNPHERAWVRKVRRSVLFYRGADVEQFLHHSPEYRDFVLLRFLYETGTRISEALGLCWRDCGQQDDGTATVTIYGKGDKTRVLRLRGACWALLSTLRNGGRPEDPVFQTAWWTRGALCREHFTRTVHKIAELAGLDVRPSPHWLRHSHATHALDNGCPWHVLQAQLGHASITSTERYVHANPSETSSEWLPPDPDDEQGEVRIIKISEARAVATA